MVRAHLGDLSLFQHHDLVGPADGAEAVGDHHHRAAFEKVVQVFEDDAFVVGIEGIGGLVEEDESRVFVNGTGDEHALPLPLADAVAAGADPATNIALDIDEVFEGFG